MPPDPRSSSLSITERPDSPRAKSLRMRIERATRHDLLDWTDDPWAAGLAPPRQGMHRFLVVLGQVLLVLVGVILGTVLFGYVILS